MIKNNTIFQSDQLDLNLKLINYKMLCWYSVFSLQISNNFNAIKW